MQYLKKLGLLALLVVSAIGGVSCTSVGKVAPFTKAVAAQPSATPTEKAIPQTRVDALTSVNQQFVYGREGGDLRVQAAALEVHRKAATEGFRDVGQGVGGFGQGAVGVAAVQGKLGTRINNNVKGATARVGDITAHGGAGGSATAHGGQGGSAVSGSSSSSNADASVTNSGNNSASAGVGTINNNPPPMMGGGGNMD